MESKGTLQTIAKCILLAGAVILVIRFFGEIMGFLKTLWNALLPLVWGGSFAYILNIILIRLERLFFPKTKINFLIACRRPVCILFSLFLIIGILVLVTALVIPKLIGAFALIGQEIPKSFEKIRAFAMTYENQFPILTQYVEDLKLDWAEITKNAFSYAGSGIGNILSTTLSFVTFFANGLFNFIISLIFAIYILANKEMLCLQFDMLTYSYIKEKARDRLKHFLLITDKTFSDFIVGQFTEAIILGSLCVLGMLIFRLPYALMVGALMGTTALIPIAGAYVGAGISAFMILTVNPLQALFFLIFITLLQQIENNLIYPKVVGASIGLPGIWVFASILVFGGLYGVMGMLLGVPITAILYKSLKSSTLKRLEKNKSKLSKNQHRNEVKK